VDKLAYRFIGDYPCELHEHPDLIKEIAEEVKNWKKSWKTAKLVLIPLADYYIIYDSRNPGKSKNHMLDGDQAKEIMTDSSFDEAENQKWAIEEKLGVVVDSRYIPLVAASSEFMLKFEESFAPHKKLLCSS
jgi:hypothetical protein